MKLAILGQSPRKLHSANPNMEPRETFHSNTNVDRNKVLNFLNNYFKNFCFSEIPANLLSEEKIWIGFADLTRHLCPGGKLQFSGIVTEEDLTIGIYLGFYLTNILLDFFSIFEQF